MNSGRPYVAPQGRVSQGWPARRCSSEPTVIDRLPEDYDDQSDSADEQVALWLIKVMCVLMLAAFCAWCIANYLDLANV